MGVRPAPAPLPRCPACHRLVGTLEHCLARCDLLTASERSMLAEYARSLESLRGEVEPIRAFGVALPRSRWGRAWWRVRTWVRYLPVRLRQRRHERGAWEFTRDEDSGVLRFGPVEQAPEQSTGRDRRVRVRFAWYDLWIGAYWDRKDRVLYLCPLPCLLIELRPKPQEAQDAEQA